MNVIDKFQSHSTISFSSLQVHSSAVVSFANDCSLLLSHAAPPARNVEVAVEKRHAAMLRPWLAPEKRSPSSSIGEWPAVCSANNRKRAMQLIGDRVEAVDCRCRAIAPDRQPPEWIEWTACRPLLPPSSGAGNRATLEIGLLKECAQPREVAQRSPLPREPGRSIYLTLWHESLSALVKRAWCESIVLIRSRHHIELQAIGKLLTQGALNGCTGYLADVQCL